MICVYVCVCMCECQPSFALRHDGKTNRPLIHLSPNCSGFNQEVSRSKTCAGEDSNPEMGQIQSTCKRTCEQVTICIRTWLFGLFFFLMTQSLLCLFLLLQSCDVSQEDQLSTLFCQSCSAEEGKRNSSYWPEHERLSLTSFFPLL